MNPSVLRLSSLFANPSALQCKPSRSVWRIGLAAHAVLGWGSILTPTLSATSAHSVDLADISPRVRINDSARWSSTAGSRAWLFQDDDPGGKTIESPRDRPAGPADPLRLCRERGLEWLAKDILAGGQVSLGTGEHRSPVGVTALVALAFLGGGNSTNRGPHQKALTKAIDFLLDHSAGPDDPQAGFISARGDQNSRNHGHGLALLALTQAYSLSPGSPRGKRMRDTIQRGVRCIEQAQSTRGGWYYSPKPMDIDEGSVTVCLLQALRGARNTGFQVDRQVIDKATAYVISLQDEQGGFIYSHQQPTSSVALTGACLSTLHATGVYEGSIVEDGYLYIWRKLALREQEAAKGGHTHAARFPYYERFYLAQALWQHPDGAFFRRWAESHSREILMTQEADGSWRDRRFDAGGRVVNARYGRAYATAMNVLYLSVPEGSLPFFQR